MKSKNKSKIRLLWFLSTLLYQQCSVAVGASLRGGGSGLWRSALIDGSSFASGAESNELKHLSIDIGHDEHQREQQEGLMCPFDGVSSAAASICPSTASNRTTPVCEFHADTGDYKTVCLKTHAVAQHSALLPHAHAKSYCGVCKKCFQDRTELMRAIDKYKSYKQVNLELADIYGWPIGKWCTDNVTSFSSLFFGKAKFNEDISQWQTSQVTDMTSMFQNAYAFNQPLDTWDTSNVKSMTRMFAMAIHFDQDISSWDVSSVHKFGYMFLHALEFNQDISQWQVHNARDLNSMFFGAESFEKHHLQAWKISEHADTQNMCQWDEYHIKQKKDSTNNSNNITSRQQTDDSQSQQQQQQTQQ
ncbi:Mycoplasma protein of unknown function, DUF285 [Seminavis robusta]|uniref:Uncharacterized protein n=1 Tax=Seminavis robusta TaxID=568900 RepID=A0A9N8H9W0_9STRA|nr:Mycoplasma protein of unknown function, DUF285 [Seminavis robusta]|eukprot:Sro205_g086190.1 Mycoplasma protein of unknown function, DUF285 (360) ;mRNA; r:27580-28855